MCEELLSGTVSDSVLLTDSSLLDHICDGISRGVLHDEPFAHLVVDNALPTDVFNTLVEDLPPAEELVSMAALGWKSVSRYEKHGTAILGDLTGRRHPTLWTTLEQSMLHPRFESTLRKTFAPYITGTAREEPIKKEVRLDCGRAGAYLPPHTDSPIVLMKALIYLSPPTEDDPRLDTLLYEPKDPEGRIGALGEPADFTVESYKHEVAENHRQVGRVRYRPNRLLAFVRTVNSLHGLAPLPDECAPRYIIAAHFKFRR
jgi:hypothetical protein